MVVGHHKGEVLGACTDCRRLWGAAPRRRDRRGRDRGGQRPARAVGRHLHGDGHGQHHGLHDRGAGPVAADERDDPGAACRALAHRRGERPAWRPRWPRPSGAAAERAPDARRRSATRRSCCRRSAARPTASIHLTAMAQRAPASRIDLDGLRRARPRGAGAGRPEALRRALHGAFPPCRRRAEAAARARRPHRPRRADGRGRHAARRRGRRRGGAGPDGDPLARQPDQAEGAMAVLRGNLAPRGAVIKHSAATPKLLQHDRPRGGVRVRRGHDARASTIPTSTSPPTTCWCCATPARRARRACRRPATCRSRRSSARGGVKDMVRISDARMSGTAFGTIVLHITPESAVGGPLGAGREPATASGSTSPDRASTCWSTRPSWRRAARRCRRPPAPDWAKRGYARLFHETVTAGRRGLRLRLHARAGQGLRRKRLCSLTCPCW